jgi:hypothetical protein
MATQGNRFQEDEMKPRIIHQVAADVFPVLTLLLYPSDFSFRMPVRRPAPTFLIFSLIGVPVRRQAIDLQGAALEHVVPSLLPLLLSLSLLQVPAILRWQEHNYEIKAISNSKYRRSIDIKE